MRTIKTLKEIPEYREEVLNLVSNSFNYSQNNKIEIDFYPLFQKSNEENLLLLFINNSLVAHIGIRVVDLRINEKNHKCIFFGGIATKEDYRGQGHFSYFFNEVLTKYRDASLYFLWSDKPDLYKKFSFHSSIGLNVYPKNSDASLEFNYTHTKFNILNEKDRHDLLVLYNKEQVKPKRDTASHHYIEMSTSSDLYLKKDNDQIRSYFFVNKGEDLKDIIHESYFENLDDLLEATQKYECWSHIKFDTPHIKVASSLVRCGEPPLFKSLIHDLTRGSIEINSLTEANINFNFNNEVFELSQEEFLSGILGPNLFEELEDNIYKIFVPGIESI